MMRSLYRAIRLSIATVVVGIIACRTDSLTSFKVMHFPDGPYQVVQDSTTSIPFNLVRGNVHSDIGFAFSGLPAGVTATITPSSNGKGAPNVLGFDAAPTAAPGTATVTVTASSVDGSVSESVDLALNVIVRGTYTMSSTPSALSFKQGTTSNAVTVSVERQRRFAQDVSLRVDGLPAGLTAVFASPVLSGSTISSDVTFAANDEVAVGTHAITIVSTSPGLPDQSASVELTILEGTTPIAIDFCAGELPLWFAYQNEGGAWTQVAADANGTVSFSATKTAGIAVTRARINNGGLGVPGRTATSVLYLTSAELKSLAGTCVNGFGTKTFTGTVAGILPGEDWTVASHLLPFVGTAAATTIRTSRKPNTGALDLIGVRRNAAGQPLSIIARRAIEIPNGSVLPVFDFATTEAVPAETRSYSVTGLTGLSDLAFVDFYTNTQGNAISTVARLQLLLPILSPGPQTSSGTFGSVPSSLLRPGDRHELTITTGGFDQRGIVAAFHAGASQTLAIGPGMTPVTVIPLGAGRVRAQLASMPEYGAMARFVFANTNSISVEATAGYLGGTPATWDLSIPDFSSVAGWNPAWSLASGTSMTVTGFASSLAPIIIPPQWIGDGNGTVAPALRPLADGVIMNFASRISTVIVP